MVQTLGTESSETIVILMKGVHPMNHPLGDSVTKSGPPPECTLRSHMS
jgi:hypothetical protein